MNKKTGIANTLLKTIDKIPASYQDPARIIWGEGGASNISLYLNRDQSLTLDYGNSAVDPVPFSVVYAPEDESYTSLKALLARKFEILPISLGDDKQKYVKKVITVMLFHQMEMKRGSQI